MDKKPNQDAMEAMREMVKTQMGFGIPTEVIIKDILGWGDCKGFTEIMILDEIREWQKNNEGKPGSPVIREPSFPIHSPKDFTEPIRPIFKKVRTYSYTPKEGDLIRYINGVSIDPSNLTLQGLITKALTFNQTSKVNLTTEIVEKMCIDAWNKALGRNK